MKYLDMYDIGRMSDSRTFVSVLLKYALLAGIAYLVTLNASNNRLDRNQVVLISFAITLIFALIDLYGGIFPGIMNAICNCPTQ